MMTPLVSVIIPSFNSSHWLADAVDSVIEQNHPRVEILIVDDGSTDGTRALIESRYGSIVNYRYQSNRGLSSARNLGLSHAAGEYVQFLDADDILLPEKIAIHVEFLERNSTLTAAFSDYAKFFGEDKKNIQPSPNHHRDRFQSKDFFSALLSGNFIVCHALLIRKQALDRIGWFDESLSACEDYDLWLRLTSAGFSFGLCGGALVLYRQHQTSMSRSRLRQIGGELAVLEKLFVYERRLSRQEIHLVNSRRAALHLAMAQDLREHGKILNAINHFARGGLLDPNSRMSRIYDRSVGWRLKR